MHKEEDRERLIKSAKKRRMEDTLAKSGHQDEGPLYRAHVPELRKPDLNLPPAEHHFHYPLCKEQLQLIKRGDVIQKFPLSIVIQRLREQTTLFDEYTKSRAATLFAEGEKCELTIEKLTEIKGAPSIVAHTKLPSPEGKSALETWGIEDAVIDLSLSDLQTLFGRIKGLFR